MNQSISQHHIIYSNSITIQSISFKRRSFLSIRIILSFVNEQQQQKEERKNMLKRFHDSFNCFRCQFHHPCYGRIRKNTNNQHHYHQQQQSFYSTFQKSWGCQYYCFSFHNYHNYLKQTKAIITNNPNNTNSNTSRRSASSAIRSPYVVLQLKRSASKAQIKDQFRKVNILMRIKKIF